MKNKINKALIVLLLVVTFTGCSQTKNQEPIGNGNKEYPTKVISLAPAITETIFAIGKGDLLIGRTDYCIYPEEALQVPVIGSIMEPNIEKILELMPDIVLVSSIVPLDTIQQLKQLGVTVISIKNEESFEGTYKAILEIGDILGANKEAISVVDGMKKEVEYVQEKVKGVPKKSTYYVIGYGEYGDYTPGGGTFINDVITMAGGINIAADMEGWQYSKEKLIEGDPDIIITKQEDIEGFKNADGYKELRAVREDNIKEIDASLLEIQSTRISKGLRELAQLLHPELF